MAVITSPINACNENLGVSLPLLYVSGLNNACLVSMLAAKLQRQHYR
jgi:hypothetical protein